MRRSLIALAAVVAGFALAPAGHAATARSCGLTPRIDGELFDVHEVHGTVPCRTVKRVVTKFLRDSTVAPHWTCFRGHGSSPYAASCARGERVLVRVYAPT